jgi:hypothetical protein
MPDIGVITEQGFAMGEGLGFAPIDESEQPKKNDDKDEKK